MWCKHTNYEQATRAPLLIVDPRMERQARKVTKPAEFLDIAPTLAQLAGLAVPDFFEGESLLPLMRDADAPFKPFAVSQFPRSFHAPNNLMGYAFRNERYRLILWLELAYKSGDREGELVATELYDYETDPLETRNLAEDPDQSELTDRLTAQARAFAAKEMNLTFSN